MDKKKNIIFICIVIAVAMIVGIWNLTPHEKVATDRDYLYDVLKQNIEQREQARVKEEIKKNNIQNAQDVQTFVDLRKIEITKKYDKSYVYVFLKVGNYYVVDGKLIQGQYRYGGLYKFTFKDRIIVNEKERPYAAGDYSPEMKKMFPNEVLREYENIKDHLQYEIDPARMHYYYLDSVRNDGLIHMNERTMPDSVRNSKPANIVHGNVTGSGHTADAHLLN